MVIYVLNVQKYLQPAHYLLVNIFLQRVPLSDFLPSKHFNVDSTLLLDWYDVATLHNVKSTLKQR